MAQSRSCVDTLGPDVAIVYILRALGIDDPEQQGAFRVTCPFGLFDLVRDSLLKNRTIGRQPTPDGGDQAKAKG